jgi:hypothetical protein
LLQESLCNLIDGTTESICSRIGTSSGNPRSQSRSGGNRFLRALAQTSPKMLLQQGRHNSGGCSRMLQRAEHLATPLLVPVDLALLIMPTCHAGAHFRPARFRSGVA